MKQWIQLGLFVITSLTLIEKSSLESNEDSNILNIVKRDLLNREKEYLKTQPLSQNLKDFIKRYKRKAQEELLKVKQDNKGEDKQENNVGISAAKELNVRDVDDTVTTVITEIPTSSDTVKDTISSSTGTVTSTEQTSTISGQISTNQTTTVTTTEAVTCKDGDFELMQDEFENLNVDVSTERKQFLGKVMKDVQELIRYENAAKTSEGEASLCNVSGDWDSYAGGMQIRVFNKYRPFNPLIKIVPREPPMHGFLAESEWNVTAVVPFKHASMISLTAVSTKGRKIATFLGECRICEDAESISGHWMIRRRSKNCKDREEANSFISDVLRKNNVRKLHREHLDVITSTPENLDNL